MSVIDSHVHLYPPAANRNPARWAAARREGHWAVLCTRRRRNGSAVQSFPSLAGLLKAMDAAGVKRAVLLGWYWEHAETCARQNRFYVRCIRKHPDRLSAFATLHPAAGMEATLEEVKRAHGDGLCGLGELSPHSQKFAPDDPTFEAVLELAGRLRMPVNLHVTDPGSPAYPGRVETPLEDFVQLAQRFPGTSFILAHWGGLLPLRLPAACTLPNVSYDTAASPLLYDEGIWRRFLDAVPAERILFGSDFPLNVYPRIDAEANMSRLVAEVHRAGLPADTLQAMVGGNAARLIRF